VFSEPPKLAVRTADNLADRRGDAIGNDAELLQQDRGATLVFSIQELSPWMPKQLLLPGFDGPVAGWIDSVDSCAEGIENFETLAQLLLDAVCKHTTTLLQRRQLACSGRRGTHHLIVPTLQFVAKFLG
jgi:hypothetical protein